MLIGLAVLAMCISIFRLGNYLSHRIIEAPLCELDPLVELEAAHRMELAEWDEQFHRLCGKWTDPPKVVGNSFNLKEPLGLKGPIGLKGPCLDQFAGQFSQDQLSAMMAQMQNSQQGSVQRECELAARQNQFARQQFGADQQNAKGGIYLLGGLGNVFEH